MATIISFRIISVLYLQVFFFNGTSLLTMMTLEYGRDKG